MCMVVHFAGRMGALLKSSKIRLADGQCMDEQFTFTALVTFALLRLRGIK